MGGSRGGTGVPDPPPPPPPPEKSQKYSFIAILDWIPWKSTRLPSQHSMLGHHRHASETTHIVVFGSFLLSFTKKTRCQTVKTFLIRAWNRVSTVCLQNHGLSKFKWKIPLNEISCQISAVYGQLYESAKTSMCIQHCFWLLKKSVW